MLVSIYWHLSIDIYCIYRYLSVDCLPAQSLPVTEQEGCFVLSPA